MAKNGGARPGSGRKKGSVNRKTIELLAGIVSEGQLPLEYLLEIVRDETQDLKRRDWAAEKAAAYIHPRPAPYARPITIELPDTGTAGGVTSALSVVVKAVGEGSIAPSEAQSLVAILEAQRKAIETGELLERIERLEKQAPKS